MSGPGPASNFILNIVELQNTITSASGLSPLAALSNTVSQLQEMIIYDEKRIAVNAISRYNASPIQVQDSLNLATGASITQDGAILAGAGSSGGASTVNFATVAQIGNGPSRVDFASTVTAGAPAISFQVSNGVLTPLVLTADGSLRLPLAGTPAPGKYLTCMDAAGTAEWQTPAMPSDARLKEDVRGLENVGEIVSSLRGVRFKWKGGEETGGEEKGKKEDLGFIAQEVQAVLPEAVVAGGEYLSVEYWKFVPVLLEEVKALRARVERLEKASV